jgi:hypothetical protein
MVEMKDLHGLGHQSVIPYVDGRMRVVLQCAIQALAWLLIALGLAPTF